MRREAKAIQRGEFIDVRCPVCGREIAIGPIGSAGHCHKFYIERRVVEEIVAVFEAPEET